jgi:hypothetical protein
MFCYARMVERFVTAFIEAFSGRPSRCGNHRAASSRKTTLAREIADKRPDSLYLELEAREDRDRLAEPVLFLRQYKNNPERRRGSRPRVLRAPRSGRSALTDAGAEGSLLRSEGPCTRACSESGSKDVTFSTRRDCNIAARCHCSVERRSVNP